MVEVTRKCLLKCTPLSRFPMRTDDRLFQIIPKQRTGKSWPYRTFLLRHACRRITVPTYVQRTVCLRVRKHTAVSKRRVAPAIHLYVQDVAEMHVDSSAAECTRRQEQEGKYLFGIFENLWVPFSIYFAFPRFAKHFLPFILIRAPTL